MSKLAVEYVAIKGLIPYARNARTHSDEQVAQIAASIREFGWTNPVLISEASDVIAGHGRLLAASKLGMDEVPCIRLAGLSETQRRAYVLADNKLALNAGWDAEMLRLELTELDELGVDLTPVGFSKDELDELFKEADGGKGSDDGSEDDDEVRIAAPERVLRGDVWDLDGHRLMCGDSTDIGDVRTLLGSDKVDMALNDPPYGIRERTKRGEAGRGALVKGYDFEPVIGDDSSDAAVKSFHLCNSVLKIPLVVTWGANHYAHELPPTPSWLIWDKRDGVKSDDNSDCELAWTNRGGPARIFAHLWKGAIKASEHGERRVHPTQKPVALCLYAIETYPKVKPRVVLDLFGGSGSTLIACEKSGVKCLMMEMEPRYCDVIVARWEAKTGSTAVQIGGQLRDAPQP